MKKLSQKESTNHSKFKRPKCYSPCFSTAKQRIWDYIQARAPYDEPLEINMSKMANILDTSRATIQHAIKTFASCGLIEKVRQRTGRGNGSIFRLLWTFYRKSETLPDNTTCYRPHPRKRITKGSTEYSYSAMHFRELLQKSHLGVQTGDVVGEIMDRLEGKLGKLAKDFYDWLERKDFDRMDKVDWFVYLSKELPPGRKAYFHVEKPENKSDALKKYEEKHKNELYF